MTTATYRWTLNTLGIRAPDKFNPFKLYLKTIQILADSLWLLNVNICLTNPPDLVISSPKTRSSVINQVEWS